MRRPVMLESFQRFFQEEVPGNRYAVCYGGAGSGKSMAIAILLAHLFKGADDLQVLVTAKTGPALRSTAFKMLKDVLDAWEVEYELNRTFMEFRRGDNLIMCKAMDEPDKLKSLNLNLAWMEEATNCTQWDFEQLDLRLRRAHPQYANTMFLSFNPVDAMNWAVKRFVSGKEPSAAVMHSTYEDNKKHLPMDYIEKLKALDRIDANFHRVYTLGLPGVLKGLIYNNWQEEDGVMFPQRYPDSMGMDLGHTNPTCLVAIWRVEGRLYIRELLYRTGMSTGDLLSWMKASLEEQMPEGEERPRRWSWRSIPIYCDPSRPEVIDDVFRAGWNCQKANNKVYDGIMYVRSFEMLVDTESVNTIRELNSYKWREDKEGNSVDEPVKWADHLPDAIRYGAFSDRPSLEASEVSESLFGGYGGDTLRDVMGERTGRYNPYWGDMG